MKASNRKENLERFLNGCEYTKKHPLDNQVSDKGIKLYLKVFSSFFSFWVILIWLASWVYYEFLSELIADERSFYRYCITVFGMMIISIEFALRSQKNSYLNFFLYLAGVVFMVFAFGFIYAQLGTLPLQNTDFEKLKDGMYLSFMTWTTVGFGDVQPIGYSRVVASIEGIFSYISMAFLVAWILNLKADKENAEQR